MCLRRRCMWVRTILHLCHLFLPISIQLLKGRRIQALAAPATGPRCQSRYLQEQLRQVISSKLTRTEETMAGLAVMHDRFLRFLRGRVDDPATAEDILQTAYVKAIQHGGELREA